MTKREKFRIRMFSAFSAVIVVLAAMSLTVIHISKAENENFDEKAKEMSRMVVVLVNEARENAVYCPACGFINDGRDEECLSCHASLEGAEDASMKPLYIVPYLSDKARERSRELISNFGHIRPDGSKWSSIIDGNIIYYSEKKENIANVYSSAEAVFQAWKESPSHWSNMMNRNATITGVGVAYEPNDSIGYYWDQIFVLTSQEFEDWYIPQKYDFMPTVPFDLNQDDTTDPFDYVILENFVSKKNSGYPVTLNPLQLERANYFKDRIEDQNKPENNIDEYDLAALKAYLMGAVDHLPCTIKDLNNILVFLEEPEYADDYDVVITSVTEPVTTTITETETTAVTTVATVTDAETTTSTEQNTGTSTTVTETTTSDSTTTTTARTIETTVTHTTVTAGVPTKTTTAKTIKTTSASTKAAATETTAVTTTAVAAESTINVTDTEENDENKNAILKAIEEQIKALQEMIETYKGSV